MKNILFSLILILCLILSGCGLANDDALQTTTTPSTTPSIGTVSEKTVESEMLDLVDTFNATDATKLVFAENFTPSDKSSSHYRTEFRLSAYANAIGKSYAYGQAIVDVVGKQSYSGTITIRIYMDGATLEQCTEMIKYASPIMDPDIEIADVQKAIDYITQNKTANGYYYADLSLLLLGSETKGYEFMLKMGND